MSESRASDIARDTPASTNPQGRPAVAMLALDQYQRDNLVAALRAVYQGGDSPLQSLNTGDWVGELFWSLDGRTDGSADGKPNQTAEQMLERARTWGQPSQRKP